MLLPLLSLLVYITTISSQARSEELFASDTVSYDGRDFTFHEQRLSWSEAASLCRSVGGSLAIVNSLVVAKFLVDSQATLPEQREYEDVWIGGRYKNGKWMWKSTGEVFPSTTGADGFPPWVNQNKNKHNCLLLDRYESTLPLFVDQECGSLRSFVCEKAQEVKLTATQSFEDNGRKYYLYKGPVSWDRAVAVCRDNDSYLALVNDLKEAKFLATALMSSSFNVRFAWLGGRLEEGSWEWLKTGDTIPSEIQADGFPPWEDGHAPLFGSECLILDRANGRKPNFVSSNCTALRSFVCEQVYSGKSETKQIFKFHGYEYLLFSQKVTWDLAVDACKMENAQLAAIEDMTTARFIATSMAKSWESLHMIWLGARQQQHHKWKWLMTGDELVSSPEDRTGYPPWRLPPTQRGVDCLAMERAVRDKVYFLQRRCEISEAFLCQRDLTTAEPVVTSLVIGDRNFTIHEKPETWERALDVCKSENSHLAVLRDNEEVQVLSNVSEIRRLWLGGHWIADKWMWIQTGETIPEVPDEEGFPNWSKDPRPKPNYDCLQLDLRKITKPKLAGYSCENTLGYLCEKIMKTEDVHEYQGLSYVVYNGRVTWEEAAAICSSKGYYLAIASDFREAQFLAHLTQEYYELWLGGVAHNGTWEWEHTGEEIPNIPQRNGYPPWVEEPTVADHNCLTINRTAEGQPVFLETQCNMTQSFVCEKGGSELSQMVDPVSSEHNKRVYTFHPQPLPWLEAMEDCQENGGSLAMLQDLNTTRFITELSTYSPDVWVGAKKIEGKTKWHWISSEEEMLPRQEGEEYPPWARPYSRPNHDCLAVNRHNPDRPIFVDLLCNESHPYVCEKADFSTEPLIESVPLADRELIFIESKANFRAAENICDGYNGMLAILNTPDLLAIGTKHAAKYQDVWIGAVVDSEGIMRWKHTGQEVPFLSTRAITVWEEENEMVITHDEYKITVNRLGIESDIHASNERSKRQNFGQDLYDGYTWNISDKTKTTSRKKSTNLYTDSQNIYKTTQNNFESTLNNYRKQQVREEHWTPAEYPSDELFKTQQVEESSSIYYIPEDHQQTHIPKYAFTESNPLSLHGSENTYPYSLDDDSDDSSYSSEKFKKTYSAHTSQNDFTGNVSVTEPFSDEQTSTPYATTYILKEKKVLKSRKQKENSMEETGLDQEWDKESTTRWREITESTLQESTLLKGQMTSQKITPQTQKWDVKNTMDWRTNSAQETIVMDGRTMQNQGTPQIENWDVGNTEEWATITPWQQASKAEKLEDSTTNPQETTSIKRKTMSQQGTTPIEKWEEENSSEWRMTTQRNVEPYKETSSTGKRLQEITEDWRMTESQETKSEGKNTDKYILNSWTDSEESSTYGQIEQQKKQRKDGDYSDSKPKLGTATAENVSIAASPSLKQNKARCLKLGPNGFVGVACHTKHSIVCERRTNSSEPVVTTYQFSGRSYGVSSQQVTWEEANNICQTNNSYLAVLTNAAEINFLANISSEFQDLWIGARVIDEVWEWEHTGQLLPGIVGKKGFPPWVNSPSRPGYNCLNLYRQGPGEVLFVDRKCNEKHGFICEDVNTGDPSPNPQEEAYQFGDRVFVFNNKLLDWDEAAEYCVSYEGVLAAFNSMDELTMLEYVNSSFHDLWVGGHVRKAEWFWEQYHEKILGISVDADVSDESSSSLKPRQSVEPAVWVNNYTRPGYDCASVYRETDNEAFLMEAKCNTRHGFVCEQIYNQTLHFRGRQYTFNIKRLNWTQAKEFCTSRGQYLAVIDDFEEAEFLADVGKVFRRMWIGARYKEESPLGWMWDHTGEAVSSDLGRFQTWIKSHQTQHSSNRCMSLFRPEDSSEIFVNSSCGQNLAFVCEETDVDELPRSVQVFFKQRPYTFYSDLLTWKEAVEACRDNGSYLAVVNDAEEAEFIAGNNYGFHDVWVGGHKEAGHWEWVHTGQYLPPVPSVPDFPKWSVFPQRYHKDCTNIYRNTNDHYMFSDRHCEERRSYVCEESGDLTETHSQTYVFKDSQYTFYTKAATWDEATDVCLSSGEYLAVVDTPEIANFIALNVSREFHDLWVDGHLEEDHWMWAHVGREIPTVQQNAEEIFPPWIHIPSRPGHECLNLYRPDNTEVQFLDRKCDEKFSFICEYGTGSEKKVQSFEFKGRTYTFYSDKVDWNKANSICRSNGTYLAIVSGKNEADFLVKVGGEFLNVWVGARQMNGAYVWNHTGEIFSTEPGPDGFPVHFKKNAYITGDACVNVGRVSGRAVFVDRQCEALHSFVCEDLGDKGETQQVTYKYNKQLYTVSSTKMSWDQASEYCAANGSYLAIINSKKEFQFLSKIASNFHDLWLGAREYGGTWKWEHTGESLLDNNDSENFSNYSNKFKPTWVESYWKDDGDKCLNVYRRNPTESLFIDQPCNRTFGFVCESFPAPIGSEPETMLVTHKGRNYSLHNQLVTWTEAVASCRASGSYLAIVTDLEEAWSLATASIVFHDLWLGGHMREYRWEWENTGQPLDISPNLSSTYPPWIRVPQQPQHNCINLYSDSGHPYFVDRRCSELHGYVCEEVGSGEETSIAEHFGGHRYVFVNKRETWSTAVDNCKAMQGYLAVASDNDELRFIVNGTRDFHDVWIGGHMSNSHWEWEHTGQKLLTPPTSPVSGSDIVNKLIPQWIRFPTRPVHDCLSVYRDNNNSAYLLDSRCNSQHTYVCEDVPVNPRKETEVKQYKHRNYVLIYERASWDEAVRVCHARGGYIAVPDDLEEARFLTSASADLHDIWVGGARKRDHPWEWTHTGRLIGAGIPWASSQPRPAHDCANLYRDRRNKPLLVARRCAQHFGFICEDTTDIDPVSQVIRFRGRNYFFSNQGETWKTAANICKSHGSYLAVVGDIDEADFIATVSRHFHDVWVGGSSENGLWEWQHTGQTIPNKRPNELLGRDGYPPWIGNTTRPEHDCLNIYRGADDTPYFVDRLCDEKHAYVCEEAGGTMNAESIQEFNGRIYKFYSRRVTWDHALEICKESGSYLAVVTEPEEAEFIARAGRDFYDLWVGGKLDYQEWEWDHTGQSIPPHNSDPSVFPRWSRETPVIYNECVNIYRDDESKPLFVDRHCSELHGFVCEEAADPPSENQVFELNGNMYIFTPNKMIWSDAYDACLNNGSTLPVVLDSQTAIFLASAGSAYHNIWLSGYLEDNHWVWKPKERRIPTIPGDDGFPAWVRSMPRPEHECLSLYRDSENKPVFLDTRCEEKRMVVCQKFNNNLGEFLETFMYDDRRFVFVHHPETWSDASEICRRNGSFLTIISDHATSRAVAKHIGSVPDIWTGGRLREHRWFWELSGEEVLSMNDDEEFPIWVGEPNHPQFECLALDSQIAGQPRFADRDCSTPKPFVCESGCLPLARAKRGQWSRSECLSRVGMRDEVCELTCQHGFELWGSRRLVCSNSGWNGTKPQCVTQDKLAYAFVERLNATLDAVVERLQSDQLLGTGILFVIGKTTTLGQAGYDQITEFLKATVAAVRLSPSQVSAGVITCGPEVVLEIPLNTSETCDFIDQADQMLYDQSGDNVNLQEALSLAKEHIENTGLYERTVIVLIMDVDSTDDPTEITELKYLGHKFFAVGIGTSVSIENLEAIASEPIYPVERSPNFYLLSSLQTFGNMVSYLNETYLYNSDLDCCMLLRTPAHGQWEPAQCSEGPGNLHDTCSIVCEEGFELVGDPKLTCTDHGWYGETGKGHIPSCHTVVMVTRSMFDRMDEAIASLDNVGILFLVDQSISMSVEDFRKQTAFVKMIVNKFLLSKTRTAGLITFNSKAIVKVPLNTSDTCSFLVALDQLNFQGGGTSFSAALQAAEEEISLHGENSTTVLFLMTDGHSYGNPKVVADRLKADGHIIFTLGVGGYKRRQLEALASVGPNQRPQFFSLADFDALDTAVSYINSTMMKSSEKHCCLKLDPDVSGVWDPPTCAVTPSEEQAVCSLNCDPGYELFGSSELSCSANGWGATMPTCFAKPDLMGSMILYQLKDLLELKEESSSIVFLVDHTDTLSPESFDMLTEFIKLIVPRFPLSNELTAGLIVTYKFGTDIEIPLDTNDTCYFLSDLDRMRREKGSSSLSRGLRLIRKLSESYDEEQNMIIVLLTDRQVISKPSVTLAKKIKSSGKSIMVIGINNQVVYNDLFEIASGEKKPNNMIIIDTYATLESVTDYLMDEEKQVAWYIDTGYSAPDC